jgi:CheY-like chemotaxis protein
VGGVSMDNAVEILLVEDNEDDIELVLRTLRKNHIANKVVVARDGQEALDYIFGKQQTNNNDKLEISNYPYMILLDLKLPKVNGLEVVKVLKSNEKTKLIPVIMMTSSTEEVDMIESYKLGVNSYINKPVNFMDFARMISELGHYWLLLNKRPY